MKHHCNRYKKHNKKRPQFDWLFNTRTNNSANGQNYDKTL